MTQSEHIGELAELYALGTLDANELRRVDDHIRTCEACAARLGEAESTMAQLVDDRTPPPSLDRRVAGTFARRWNMRLAASITAAAFVVGLLPTLVLWSISARNDPFTGDQQQAVQAMVRSHFAHTPFTRLAPDAPAAKLIYSRGHDWRYIVADSSRSYQLAAIANGRATRLGMLHVKGSSAELFVAHSPARMFELLDGARAVARVTLPYRP